MPRTKKTVKVNKVTREPRNNDAEENSTYFEKLETDIKSNQNTLSLILGALIVIVVGVLIFNYFNRQGEPQISPEGENTITNEQNGDVSPDKLPGKYTIKEGDTLFTIAQQYYNDGYKYAELVKANNLPNENDIAVGQVIDIPKLEDQQASAPEASPTTSPEPQEQAMASASPAPQQNNEQQGTGGQEVKPGEPADTSWGPAIRGETYTVAEGDWLSTIAARAYGDVLSFEKIAKANNIQNPDVIAAGTVLKLPR